MKTPLPLLIALISAALITYTAQAQTEVDPLPTIKAVSNRVAAGDVKAMEDLKGLPTDHAVAALLMFFKSNFYAWKAPPKQVAIWAKAVELVPQVPGAEDYFKKLWKNPPGKLMGVLVTQRETSIDLLAEVKGKFGTRILLEALLEPDIGTEASHIQRVLLKLKLPDAPFTSMKEKGALRADGQLKWKEWWAAHKADYASQE